MQSTRYNGLKVSVTDIVYLSKASDAQGFEVVDISDDAFTLGIRQFSTGQQYARQEIDISYVYSVDTSL